jgi:hypothetical protein
MSEVPDYDELVEVYAWEKTYVAEKKKRRQQRLGWLDAATRWRTWLGQPLHNEHLFDRIRLSLCQHNVDRKQSRHAVVIDAGG